MENKQEPFQADKWHK